MVRTPLFYDIQVIEAELPLCQIVNQKAAAPGISDRIGSATGHTVKKADAPAAVLYQKTVTQGIAFRGIFC